MSFDKRIELKLKNGFMISCGGDTSHYCTVGETVEVAIFDTERNWYCKNTGIEAIESKADAEPGNESRVFGHVTAEEFAQLILKIGEV